MDIVDHRRKNRRKRDTTECSSSEKKAGSKPPKDVLELGKYISRQLDLQSRGDTLAHWMAHHVAELIHAAENESDKRRKGQARKDACTAILKIWENRFHLPGQVHPLSHYKEILETLATMRKSATVWDRRGGNEDIKAARQLQRLSSQLETGILALEITKKSLGMGMRKKAAEEMLSSVERSLLQDMRTLAVFVQRIGGSLAGRPEERNSQSEVAELRALILRWVEQAQENLDKIRSGLQTQEQG